jgi:pSer/pThr/pTyr-binding forkhead associated (FHA) protein
MDQAPQPAEADVVPFQGRPASATNVPQNDGPFQPMRLVLRPGGCAVELTRPDMIVGRHSDADIRLGLPDVSRRHCRFVFASSRWQVFDLNSLNGIYVNDELVKQATIDHGDFIRIGGFVLQAEIGYTTTANDSASAKENATCANVIRSIAEALPLPTSEPFPQRKAS